ncbi:acyl-CoA carboxylase subunit epsilon [Amycolatopsis sp. NPDC059657]|uniref:acyl-CoA carboxylase subunit epsilon n=1 Tax=Amycolatopsis sp. NPDC059657 TaxID=3346899 RepID=UPI00366E8F51
MTELRVLNGNPSPEELAALVVTLAWLTGRDDPAPVKTARPRWFRRAAAPTWATETGPGWQ